MTFELKVKYYKKGSLEHSDTRSNLKDLDEVEDELDGLEEWSGDYDNCEITVNDQVIN